MSLPIPRIQAEFECVNSGGNAGTFSRPVFTRQRSSNMGPPSHTSRPETSLAQIKSWGFHVRSIWLFTFSDLKTIVGPKTVFGIVNALSAPAFGLNTPPKAMMLLQRALLVILWTWINLLPFAIDNQRQPAAITEDSLNKPWRPMPSRRLTPKQAKRIMFTLYPVAGLASFSVGGFRQCIALMILGYWYNNREGADVSCIVRNLINACGFVCYSSGAMEVALGYPLRWQSQLAQWFLIIGAVIFSTVQTQDLYDQAGDKLRGRNTVPLVTGDAPARWMTVIAMGAWCTICPIYWSVHYGIGVAFALLGTLIIFRCLTKRSVSDDKTTFRLWNLWVVFMYSLPLIKLKCS